MLTLPTRNRIHARVPVVSPAAVPRDAAPIRLGTQRRFLLAAILLLALAVGAVGWTVFQLRNDAVRAAISELGNIASILSGQLARSLDAIDAILLQIKKSLQNLDLPESGDLRSVIDKRSFYESLSRYLARLPWIFNIAIADQNGRIIVSTAGWPTPAIDIADRDYFLEARIQKGDELNVSVPIRNRIDGRQSIVLSRRIQGEGGAFLGIVYVGVNTSYFEGIYTSVQSINSLLFTLVRKDGIILFRHPNSAGDAGRKLSAEAAWLAALAKGETGFQILAVNDGNVRFVTSRAVSQYPLFVNTSVTEASALANWRSRAAAIGIGSAVLLLCSIGLLISVGRQVHRLRSSEAGLAHLAHHDALTGLANRTLFAASLSDEIRQITKSGGQFAVLMLDLDQFKAVNDTYGHGVGDELLRAAAGRLQSVVGGVGLVARLGGDEFAVLRPLMEDVTEFADLGRRILQEIVKPYLINETELIVGTSIGIAVAPQDGIDAESLMKNADAALYRSKSTGRNKYGFFAAWSDPHVRECRDPGPSLQPVQQDLPKAEVA